jgi:hypothetical protein
MKTDNQWAALAQAMDAVKQYNLDEIRAMEN